MSNVFLKCFNLSITAGWLILAVILVRLLLKKAPKRIVCLLWALVAVRLICPFSIESALSLVPSAETVDTTHYAARPYIRSGVDIIDDAANDYLGDRYFEGVTVPTAESPANPINILSVVWLVGIAALLLYALISYLRLRKSVAASIPVRDGILACDEVKSPFILGTIKPRIYIPSSLKGETLRHVITHETAHIKRHDHWWKPLGFLILAVYWFHPLCWIAYVLLCRDMETACDEAVIRDMDKESKAAYSQALLDCSLPRRRIAACPLAFGEVGVKERVRSVLNYKKPAFWIIVVAVVSCIVVAVCFLTDPKSDVPLSEMLSSDYRPDCVWTYVSRDGSVNSSFTVNNDKSVAGSISKDGETTEFSILYRIVKHNAGKAVCEFYACSPELANQAEGEEYFMFEARMKAKNGRIEFEFFDENGTACFGKKKVQFALAASEKDTGTVVTSAPPSDSPTPETAALREKYPEYFDLPTGKGLEVYVWQMSKNSYSFGLLPGTNREKTFEELFNLRGVSAKDMKAILSTYDLNEPDIDIIPWQNPISSHASEYLVMQEGETQSAIDARRQKYIDNIRSMLFD